MVDNYNLRILVQDKNSVNTHRVSDDMFARPVLSWEARLT